MSSKSAAQRPVKTHSLFNRNTALWIAFIMAVVYVLTVVVYPLVFTSERESDSSLLDQPVIPPTPPPIK